MHREKTTVIGPDRYCCYRCMASFATRTANSQSIAPLPADVDEATLSELALSYRILVNQGVLDAYGHVSIRHPKNPNRFLMARSGEVAPAYVTPNDIMEFDLDSSAIELRSCVLHSERFIHGEIYKVRPDVNAVVHSHSRAVIPFGVTRRRCERSSTTPRFSVKACRFMRFAINRARATTC